MRTLVYPATFYPITLGHADLIQRAAKLCDRLIVAVAAHPEKKPLFSLEKRTIFVEHATKELENVDILPFDGLLVDFVTKHQGDALMRGLRAVSDFEYEFQLACMNRQLAPEIETLFLIPSEKYAFISSSLVKEVASYGGDVSRFVPKTVLSALLAQ
jgi:pantetheine-phosphate adenylyltransferase